MGYGSEMDGCGRFMKYSLFFANFVIFVAGCTVTGLAIWALVDKIPYIGELVGNDLLTSAVYVLLGGGIIAAIVAFFGCIGASREVKCMLLTYFILVLILFVTIFIGGVFSYVFRSRVLGTLEQDMKNSMFLYNRHSIRSAWDATQRSLHCCGVNSYREWINVGNNIPKSCCREVMPGKYFDCNSGPDSANPSNTYVIGCLNTTTQFIEKHASSMGAAGIVVACLMFFGMIFSCVLFRMIE